MTEVSVQAPNCSIISPMTAYSTSKTAISLSSWLSLFRLFARAGMKRWLLTLVVLTSFSSQVNGLQVLGLYSFKIPVANESTSERNRAFSEALAAVIVKVTGEQRWLLDPAVITAVENAQSYVEAVSYSSEIIELTSPEQNLEDSASDDSDQQQSMTLGGSIAEVPTEELPLSQAQESELISTDAEQGGELVNPPAIAIVEQRYINVNFSATLINELLLDAQIPVWDSNRPSVLVWMTLQNEVGERTFLNTETNPEIVKLIQEFADQRGLPIIFPVFDFEDRRNVTEDTIWSLDESAIRQASARYGADSVMSGRLHFTASGELVGVWQFIFQDQIEIFDGFDEALKPYLYEPLDKITTQLASYFAIVPETGNLQFIELRVDGIGDLQAYASLMNYLNGLGLVESATTQGLDGERLDLGLSLVGDPTQLVELIALDRDLLPIQSSQLELGSQLHYRWTR